ncbi:aromatic ring-hydroxylating dioxygenase subunit alpha [uncultured Roseibium sp.]|uniref:aromatic ring-hydroxylating dioxygenase subunit alpha n=1 Tax=uncultured Roseibium sp. TaxID=1936171 RepID=UPI003216A840
MTVQQPITRADLGPSEEAIEGFRQSMSGFWHPVCEASALDDGRPVGVTLLGRRVVLVRLDGKLAALPDTCRHFQAQLSLGEVVTVGGVQALQCPYHGWAFGEGGKCKRIPQLAEGRAIPAAADLPAYLAEEKHGLIWVCLSDEPKLPLPEFPELHDSAFRSIRLTEEELVKTSSTRMIMGTLDDTHFPWVHEGILGERDHPEPPDHRAWREGHELIVQYETVQPPGLLTVDQSKPEAADAGDVTLTYTDYVSMPGVIRLVKDSPSGRYVIWLATSPVDWNLTQTFWIFSRNFDLAPESDGAFLDLASHVRKQDKPVIESQRPWLVPPFWTQMELPVGPGDLPLMQYQQWIEELGIATAI